MFYFAFAIMLFHLIILYLWFINSSPLFNWFGYAFWVISIVFGIIVYQQWNEKGTFKKLLSVSNWGMVFLIMVTVAIFFTTRSMP
ncbi:hypothetical protein D8M04_12030 [Oceanobacillus piezotolerans]|uniref:Uncharacterized protein n=1 Tax=Oceanobacillus piezotolerans TaxID=2448030 RepID=A0A498D483_9BACI|nr:hypothetical protein [Oceanobacillus piezotolerans]RLL43646.1 hypothetical protein D8M04_12030 [Oceanobacillus piezotolerans]